MCCSSSTVACAGSLLQYRNQVNILCTQTIIMMITIAHFCVYSFFKAEKSQFLREWFSICSAILAQTKPNQAHWPKWKRIAKLTTFFLEHWIIEQAHRFQFKTWDNKCCAHKHSSNNHFCRNSVHRIRFLLETVPQRLSSLYSYFRRKSSHSHGMSISCVLSFNPHRKIVCILLNKLMS